MNSLLKQRFTQVFADNLWGDDESRSGEGSRINSLSVARALTALERMVRDHGATSMADIPCGDFNWMPLFLGRRPSMKYLGFDIVEDAIAQNRERWPERDFYFLDITVNIPPKVDVIFSKDLVNHLVFADVKKCLNNFKRSGSTFLVISNNFDHVDNVDVDDIGESSRFLDITLPPFNYPAPIWHDGYMACWRLDDLPYLD